jgi:hypothetical protein
MDKFMDNIKIRIIFLKEKILLSKKKYRTWRKIQKEFSDYKASLRPMNIIEVINYFIDDFGNDDKEWPFKKDEIIDYCESSRIELLEKINWIKNINNKISEMKYKEKIEANLLKNRGK